MVELHLIIAVLGGALVGFSLALVGAVLAWAYEFPALMWAALVVGIGELLESSYYISVLRWRQRSPTGVRRTAALPRSPA